jgi:MFS family permease
VVSDPRAAFYSHAALVQVLTFVLRPTATYRAVELEVATHWLGVLAAGFAIMPLLLAVVVGRATDRYGERAVMLAGSVLVVAGALGFVALGAHVPGLVLASSLLGLGHLCSVVGQQALVACAACSAPPGWCAPSRSAAWSSPRWTRRWSTCRRWARSSLALSAAALALVAVPMPIWLLFAVVALAGFGLGVGQPMTMSWLAETTPVGVRATAMSLRLTGNRLGQVAVPSAAGLVALGTGAGGVLVLTAATLAVVGATTRGLR